GPADAVPAAREGNERYEDSERTTANPDSFIACGRMHHSSCTRDQKLTSRADPWPHQPPPPSALKSASAPPPSPSTPIARPLRPAPSCRRLPSSAAFPLP